MGLDALVQAGQALTNIFSGISGIGAFLVIAGLGILLAVGAGFVAYILIQFIKSLPKMTPWEFLKFVIVSAVALIIVGIIVP
ncbi:MAG: hypothetical protein J7L82_05225 [Staphylothermus sp.]|nr:hypothetical protein [Staphylothermus sp.]